MLSFSLEMVLLKPEFAPVTFQFGFIESPFPQLREAFELWFVSIDAKFGLKTEFKDFMAPLQSAILALEPLTTPLDRYLLVETKSNWTAVFANGLRVNDVTSPVGHLPLLLKCRGLEVGHAPDRSKSIRKDLIRRWGHTMFALNGPEKTDWLNRIRHVSVANDVGGWEFSADGEVQQCEETENYKKRQVSQRFTPEMLERYCGALGIELNNLDFYGPRCSAIRTTGQEFRSPESMSIAEANSRLDL